MNIEQFRHEVLSLWPSAKTSYIGLFSLVEGKRVLIRSRSNSPKLPRRTKIRIASRNLRLPFASSQARNHPRWSHFRDIAVIQLKRLLSVLNDSIHVRGLPPHFAHTQLACAESINELIDSLRMKQGHLLQCRSAILAELNHLALFIARLFDASENELPRYLVDERMERAILIANENAALTWQDIGKRLDGRDYDYPEGEALRKEVMNRYAKVSGKVVLNRKLGRRKKNAPK